MTLQHWSPLRWHLGLTGVMAFASAAMGSYLLLSSGSSSVMIKPRHRSLPALQNQVSDASAVRQQHETITHQIKATQTSLDTQKKTLGDLMEKSIKEEARMKAMSALLPEEIKLQDFQKNPPAWQDLELPKADERIIIEVWLNPKDDQTLRSAITLMDQRKSKLQQDKINTEKGATMKAGERLAMLKSLQQQINTNHQILVASLDISSLSSSEAKTLMEAIRGLLSSGVMRALPGQNFTNTVGIELVWVPDGGFWIGKREVSKTAFDEVMKGNGLSAQSSGGSASGISWTDALQFCINLTKREQAADSTESHSSPKNSQYSLPYIAQWQLAQSHVADLSLENFSGGVNEWSMSKYDPSLNLKSSVASFAVRQSNWQYALSNDTADLLPPNMRSYSKSGTASKATGTAGNISIYNGQVGLRVILVPAKNL